MLGSSKRSHDEGLGRELAFHLEELTQAYLAQGLNTREARRQALLDLDGPTR